LDAPAVVGELAASLALVPVGARLSVEELRQELTLERFRRGLGGPVKT
jgi:hypothetical protein